MTRKNRKRSKKIGGTNVSLNIEVNIPATNSKTNTMNAEAINLMPNLADKNNWIDEPKVISVSYKEQKPTGILLKTLSQQPISKSKAPIQANLEESYDEYEECSYDFEGSAYGFRNFPYGFEDNCSHIRQSTYDSDEDIYIKPSKNSWISVNESSQDFSLGYDNEDTSVSLSFEKGARPKTNGCKPGDSDNNVGWKINLEVTKKFGEHISSSVQSYEGNWEKFKSLYLSWKNQRQNTIRKLEDLKEEVHRDQLGFNQTNVMFKEMNLGSRTLKNDNVPAAVDFFASLATFLTDAASGITSVAQAINVDNYVKTFKEIMEHDAGITQPLYRARSQCLERYRDVEEVLRSFHSDTFGETMESVNKVLKTEDLWVDIKNAYEKGKTWEIINKFDKYFARSSRADVAQKVCGSLLSYADSNPAALEACKSAGKAIYDVYDTWGRDPKQSRASITGGMSIVANTMLLHEERQELYQLKSIVNNEVGSQAKLESDVLDAINSLQSELREFDSLFDDDLVYTNW